MKLYDRYYFCVKYYYGRRFYSNRTYDRISAAFAIYSIGKLFSFPNRYSRKRRISPQLNLFDSTSLENTLLYILFSIIVIIMSTGDSRVSFVAARIRCESYISFQQGESEYYSDKQTHNRPPEAGMCMCVLYSRSWCML